MEASCISLYFAGICKRDPEKDREMTKLKTLNILDHSKFKEQKGTTGGAKNVQGSRKTKNIRQVGLGFDFGLTLMALSFLALSFSSFFAFVLVKIEALLPFHYFHFRIKNRAFLVSCSK